ncbi:hypothetical protein [Clostridium sp. JN-1]|uniref:hypothetical protein n=1 Tax=Clostridium sp. JN-1 TaxID=2483110 RepID=UPI000F0B337C|nr:hypothetical protein [Clostridium sp. JN-1]
MLNNLLKKDEEINTDADASLKGIGLQKLRAVERLLRALIDGKKAVLCTIEYIDDVLEVDISNEKISYTTEQNKSYSSLFSINSHEVKNSLRIFFDNWRGITEDSECIQFVFYTNTKIAKENKVGVLKKVEEDLPKEPLLKLLADKNYDKALPFVLPVFKEYYLEQHKKHTQNINTYEQLLNSMTGEQWKKFFDLIEWNFGEGDENEVRKNVYETVSKLCSQYSIEVKFVDKIIASLLDMIESRTFEKDFLRRVVHVAEVKLLFLDFARDAKVVEKIDPTHLKWDSVKCDDVRDINDKILEVSPAYDKDMLEELEEEYIDGAFEQKHYPEIREIKAYNYRVYVVCRKIVRRAIKEKKTNFTQDEINEILDNLTDEAEKLIIDKSKTYRVPFKDRDMVRKTILLLFQECYLAFDERRGVNE